MFNNAMGSRKNNFTFSHPIFRPSSTDRKSQNPRNRPAITVVLRFPISRVWPKSGRQFCEVIFARTLKQSKILEIPPYGILVIGGFQIKQISSKSESQFCAIIITQALIIYINNSSSKNLCSDNHTDRPYSTRKDQQRSNNNCSYQDPYLLFFLFFLSCP